MGITRKGIKMALGQEKTPLLKSEVCCGWGHPWSGTKHAVMGSALFYIIRHGKQFHATYPWCYQTPACAGETWSSTNTRKLSKALDSILAKHLESTTSLQVFKGPKKFLITVQDVSCLCWREGALPCFVMKSLHAPAHMVYQELQCEPIGLPPTQLSPTAAETYEAKAATQYNIHWPNEGFWSGQHGRSLQDWMSTHSPSQYHVLLRRPSKKTSKKWPLTTQHKIPSTSKVDKRGYILHSEVPAGVPLCKWCPCSRILVWWFDISDPTARKLRSLSLSEHQMAGQSVKQHHAGECRNHQPIHHAETETYVLARPQSVNGRWPDSHGSPLLRICATKTSARKTWRPWTNAKL